MRRLLLMLLIALLALGPGLATAAPDCPMAGMSHPEGKALAALCKAACLMQATLDAPNPVPAALPAVPPMAPRFALAASRPTPPEAPPPKA